LKEISLKDEENQSFNWQYVKQFLLLILTGNRYNYSSTFFRANNLQLINISSELIVVYLEELIEMMRIYSKNDKELQSNLENTCLYFFEVLVIIYYLD